MNKIEHEQKQKELDLKHIADERLSDMTRRTLIASAIAASVGLVLCDYYDKKGTKMKVYDLNEGYTHHKANFDELFVYADQNRTVPWSKKDEGQKDLSIPTGKGDEKYILSLKGDQMTLILSAYGHEYIWRYIVNTGLLEVKGNIDFNGAIIHFGKLQNLIREQYPNF